MVLASCARLGLCCGVVCAVLAWGWSGPAVAQTVTGPEHAVYVDELDRPPDAPGAALTRYRHRGFGYGYPHARGYGSAYGYGYPYGWPYLPDRYYGAPYAIPHRLRQWGPYGYPFSVPGQGFRGRWIDDDYRQWRYWHLSKKGKQRTKRLLEARDLMMSRGVLAFASGQYEQARSAFVLAADMDKGDPASRIHVAHSCFALGRYGEAVRHLRRAFQLEPRIRELPYDIRTDYGRQEDFDEHLAALRAAVAAFPKEVDPLILLGYVHLYTGQRTEAYQALSRASERLVKGAPRDELIAALIENCKPPRFAARKPAS